MTLNDVRIRIALFESQYMISYDIIEAVIAN